MKVILQNRELPRRHFKDTVWSLYSFQARRRQSLNLVGVAGFCPIESGQRKVLALCWKTSTERGKVGPAEFSACRLTMNSPFGECSCSTSYAWA